MYTFYVYIIYKMANLTSGLESHVTFGGVAQMVERSLSMREVRGSMPRTSIFGCGMFCLLGSGVDL